MTLPLKLYRVASRYLAGAALPKLERKMEDAGLGARRDERRGQASLPRPEGRLFWLHGASVGEGLSLLALAERLLAQDPDLSILLTTGTIGGAKVLTPRARGRIQHQFAPLDSPPFVKQFLAYWRPDRVVIVESELWPNTLLACKAAGIPVALVNARLSANARRQWNRMGRTIATLLGIFDLVHVQDEATATALKPLIKGRLLEGGNLKGGASPLPYEPAALTPILTALKDRPHWLAASTHKGEEELIFAAHRALLEQNPDLLLILVPRHIDRADEIAALAEGLSLHRRSLGEDMSAQVYMADTFGEMGLWLRAAPFVALGGSWRDGIGGHNPWEPATLGKAVVSGPYVSNAATDYATLERLGAAKRVPAEDLAATVTALLQDPATTEHMGQIGLAHTLSLADEIEMLATTLLELPRAQ